MAIQTVLSAKDYFGLGFPFRFVSTHINVIIEQTRNLKMVRYAHEHLHHKFSKGTANVAATTGKVGILKYVLDNGAPVSVYTLRILNARLKRDEWIRLKRENVFY